MPLGNDAKDPGAEIEGMLVETRNNAVIQIMVASLVDIRPRTGNQHDECGSIPTQRKAGLSFQQQQHAWNWLRYVIPMMLRIFGSLHPKSLALLVPDLKPRERTGSHRPGGLSASYFGSTRQDQKMEGPRNPCFSAWRGAYLQDPLV